MLLHTGLPNPGLRQVLRKYASQWARASIPIIVHILGDSPEDVHRMVLQLEEVDGVAGIELGLPSRASTEQIAELIQAGVGELPLVVRVPLDGLVPDPLPELVSFGPPRGTLPGDDSGSFVGGRLLGPVYSPNFCAWCNLFQWVR
ncbi:MAG: hypothetical protein HC806_09045 [Anaerolineae bacterium]|nr:hypothetical protein [Anaerolineae bacterium]